MQLDRLSQDETMHFIKLDFMKYLLALVAFTLLGSCGAQPTEENDEDAIYLRNQPLESPIP